MPTSFPQDGVFFFVSATYLSSWASNSIKHFSFQIIITEIYDFNTCQSIFTWTPWYLEHSFWIQLQMHINMIYFMYLYMKYIFIKTHTCMHVCVFINMYFIYKYIKYIIFICIWSWIQKLCSKYQGVQVNILWHVLKS